MIETTIVMMIVIMIPLLRAKSLTFGSSCCGPGWGVGFSDPFAGEVPEQSGLY